MNAKEFYVHLREADHTKAATPEELAQPRAGMVGKVSTNPFENVLGKLEEATRIIGELFQVIAIGKQIIDGHEGGAPNPRLTTEYNRRLTDLGVTRDDLNDAVDTTTEPRRPTPSPRRTEAKAD